MRVKIPGHLILIFLSLAISNICRAQGGVGIGTPSPHNSAVLHVFSSERNKGVLIPRLTSGEIANITNADEGLLVYDSTYHNFVFRYGGQWQTVGTPRGGIIMWSGTTPPAGWALCDGRRYLPNGAVDPTGVLTPDLKGRFIVGLNSGNTDYDTPGETGGAASVTLTAAQSGLPSHNHTVTINNHSITDPGHNHGITDPGHSHQIRTARNGGNGEITKMDADNAAMKTTETATTGITVNSRTTGISISAHVASIGNAGGTNATQAHENRPPYYVLAFIMKL